MILVQSLLQQLNGNKMKELKCFFLLIFLLSISNFAPCQGLEGKPSVVTIDGKTFNLYNVESGETIYGICKKNNVTEAQLLDWNPELKNGLKKSMVLKILKASNKTKIEDTKPNNSTKIPETHLVEAGQTLYTISKLYSIAIDSIELYNPKVKEFGLKAGEIISLKPTEKKKIEEVKKIEKSVPPPVQNNVVTTKENEVKTEKEIIKEEVKEIRQNGIPIFKEELTVSLLLPFYLSKNEFPELIELETEETKTEKQTSEPSIYGKSYNALEFLSGFKMACDSLKKMGCKIQLNVIDCPADSAEVLALLHSEKLKSSTIIFGPFHQNYCAMIADFCLKNKIWYVTPFSQQSKILLNNPFVLKASSSQSTQMERIADYVFKNKQKSQVVLVHNNLKKEKNLVDAFKFRFKELSKDSIRENVFKSDALNGLKLKLNKNKENVLIVCSNDQAFVTDFINKISGIKTDYPITLIGMETWASYENLEVEVLQELNLHIPSNTYCDLREEKYVPFLNSFRKEFFTDPSKFALSGFDLGYLILDVLSKDKTSFANRIQNQELTGLHSNYLFKKSSPESGYENTNVYMLKFINMELFREE